MYYQLLLREKKKESEREREREREKEVRKYTINPINENIKLFETNWFNSQVYVNKYV